jgi:hypothetical protein
MGYSIKRGTVLMMNPGYLRGRSEVQLNEADPNPLGGNSPHFYICLDDNPEEGGYRYWVPITSHPREDSVAEGDNHGFAIPQSGKTSGCPQFTGFQSWGDKRAVWRIPDQIVQHYAGVYDSLNKQNNLIAEWAMPFQEG